MGLLFSEIYKREMQKYACRERERERESDSPSTFTKLFLIKPIFYIYFIVALNVFVKGGCPAG